MKQGKKSLQLNERKRKFFRLASGTLKSVFFCVSVKDGLSEMRRLKGGVLVSSPPPPQFVSPSPQNVTVFGGGVFGGS